MAYVLFHIPHASIKIPKRYWSICIKEKKYIKNINIELSDYMVEKIVPNKSHKILFKYSRIFCDVEKYKDDKKEIMSEKGMGVIYTNDCYNQITNPNKKYKRTIIKSYYDKYHSKLNKRVTEIIKKNKCIIIDFHSYSDNMVEKLFNVYNNPDICIGVDEIYTDQKLVNITINHFKQYGYKIDINTPYKGTMIPNKYINKKENKLSSIMIEINKRIYINNIKDFNKIKKCIEEYYYKIKKL